MEQSKDDIIEKLLEAMEGAANLMRGMQLDPRLPDDAKRVLKEKVASLDLIVSENEE